MQDNTAAAIREHAERDFPRESCGLIVIFKGKERYIPCANSALTKEAHFKISAEEYADAEDLGDIVAVVHSHPNEVARPSAADLVNCENTKLPWHIVHVSVPDVPGATVPVATDINTFEPSGYEAPLVGRPFVHGTLDCYALIRDWFQRERGITLLDFDRDDEWWLRGENLYMDNFAKAGFAPITGPIQVGDVPLMQVRSPVPNHAGVYLGGPQCLILQHVAGRLSSRDVYGDYWQDATRMIIRYQGPQA